MKYSGIRSQNFVWPENILAKSNPWCQKLQFSQLKLEQFELSGTVLESSEPADFKTVLGDPKKWRFIGDINKNATGEFFLGHPVGVLKARSRNLIDNKI